MPTCLHQYQYPVFSCQMSCTCSAAGDTSGSLLRAGVHSNPFHVYRVVLQGI